MHTPSERSEARRQGEPSKPEPQGRSQTRQGHDQDSIFRLQRAMGNQGVLGLLQSNSEGPDGTHPYELSSRRSRDISGSFGMPGADAIHHRLPIGAPDDIREQEADRTADRVMRMVEPAMPVASSAATPVLQRNTHSQHAAPAEAPPIVHEVVNSPGIPLDPVSRAFFEPRFGYDFSKVRVHTNTRAAESARSVNAIAYAVDHSLAFSAGRYAPHTFEGKRLLAHELAHVVQQHSGNPKAVQRTPAGGSPPEDRDKIAKATAELDRLQEVAKKKGQKLSSQDALAAYDAVHSVVMNATSSKDVEALEKARQLKSRLDSIVHGTDAAKPPSFTPHPAASQDPMTFEESSRTVTAQRGFDSGLNAQKIDETQQEIKQKQSRLDEVEAQLKSASSKGKSKSKTDQSELENLRAERSRLMKEIANSKTRIAVSRPTLIEADPAKLRAQKQDLEARLAKGDLKPSQQTRIQGQIDTLKQQIEGLTSGREKVPPSALQGGKLGTPDLSSKDSFDRLQSHQKTYVTVQIVGPDGNLRTVTFQAHNDPANDLHAEDVVMAELRKLPKAVLDGATIIVTGDQEICDRCAPRLADFAKKHGAIAEIKGRTAHGPKLTPQRKDSGDAATAKTTTAKISDPVAVEKMEKAQEEAGKKKPGEPLKQTYREKTIYPTVENQSGGSPNGDGKADSPSAKLSGKVAAEKDVTPSKVIKQSSDPDVPNNLTKKPARIKTHPESAPDAAVNKAAQKQAQTKQETDQTHGRSAYPHGGVALDVAKHAVRGAGTVFTAKVEQLVRENSHDPELNSALDTLDKAVDLKNFAENPAQFAAQAIKSEIIQGVFNHFSKILAAEQQKFTNKFPDVASIHKDPLDQGISFEDYERLYNKTRLDLRIPVGRKALMYALVLLGTNKDTPDEEIRRRVEIADQAVLNLPDIIAYARRFTQARDLYGWAMFSVTNKESVLLDQLADIPANFPAELRRRGRALTSAGKALTDLSDKIMESGLVVFDPVFAVATELETLGKGFSGLGSQFEDFADLAGRRKGEYEQDLEKTKGKSQKVNADRSSLL